MEFRMSEGFTFLSTLTPYLLENYILPSGIRRAFQFPLGFNEDVNIACYLNMPDK